MPPEVGHLAVDRRGLPRHPPAREDEIEVVGPVSVGVGHARDLVHPRETVDADLDARLLGGLARGGVGGLLARIDDPRDRGEPAVVAAPTQQHVVPAHDDGGHPDERERQGADASTQVENEVRSGHRLTVTAGQYPANASVVSDLAFASVGASAEMSRGGPET